MESNASFYNVNRLYDSFVTQTGAKGRYYFVLDIQKDIARWSPEALADFPLPGEYIHRNMDVIKKLLPPEDSAEFAGALQAFSRGILDKKEYVWRIRGIDGEYIPCSVKCYALRDYAGRSSCIAAAITSKGVESHVDPTTGLPDEVRFLEHLKKLFTAKRSAVIMLIGTNGFSEINTLYGYTFGNKVISNLAARLRELSNRNASLFRGQGTSLIFCTDTMSADEVQRIGKALKNYALRAMIIEGTRVTLHIGAGIVIADDPNVDVHAILACARYALTQSEDNEGGDPKIFHNDYLSENTKTLELVNAIHGDVEHDCRNFSLFYQPILQTSDRQLIGSAAYLRWEKEPFGSISPGEFLKWLEKDTSFSRLGNWILERALTEGKTILEAHPDIMLNINLAQRQLEQSEFHQHLLNMLRKTGFPGKNLCLELTDRCRFLDPSFLRSEVIYIKSCGIKVALDGSCLLDLRLVRELPVDVIKVGREFTGGLKKNDKDRALLKALSSFAEESGIRVCAEGVEDADILDLIQSYGIHAYQGYVSSPPVPLADFIKLF